MNLNTPTQHKLFGSAMFAVLSAQFLSAMADNMLLIGAIQLIRVLTGSETLTPWLQAGFLLPYILLAPLVGPFADNLSKGRVMLIANLVKAVGGITIVVCATQSSTPHIAIIMAGYAIAGIGAAIYSPAKYGILTQLFGPDLLVKANGMMEGSTIVAILLGVLAGGWIADQSVATAIGITAGSYLLAALLTLLIPKLPAEHPLNHFDLATLVRNFIRALTTLFKDPWARLSLIGTGLFWGSGSTLRLILFAWVPVALGMHDAKTPANLMGAVSIGIVAGAALASQLVSIKTAGRALIGGVVLGAPILLMAITGNIWIAGGLLVVMGVAGGFFIVPLNAVLQESGHHTVGAGQAIAVQNFVENLTMFLLASSYGLANQMFSPNQTIAGFGLLILIAMTVLTLTRPKAQCA